MAGQSSNQSLEPLSDFWRGKKSSNQLEELADILEAARGYVDFFGEEYDVEWSDFSGINPDKKKIILNYRPLDGKTSPYNGADIDVVMGYAIHESGHAKYSYSFNSLPVYLSKKLYRVMTGSSQYVINQDRYNLEQFTNIANIVEDFYVENIISETYPTLGAYMREGRKLQATQEIPPNLVFDLTTSNPTLEAMATMLGLSLLCDKNPPKEISPQAMILLNQCMKMAATAAKASNRKRMDISYAIWDLLNQQPKLFEKEQERLKRKLDEQIKKTLEEEKKKQEEEQQEKQEKSKEQPKSYDKSEPKSEKKEEPEKSDDKSEEDEKSDEDSEASDNDEEKSDKDEEKGGRNGETSDEDEPPSAHQQRGDKSDDAEGDDETTDEEADDDGEGEEGNSDSKSESGSSSPEKSEGDELQSGDSSGEADNGRDDDFDPSEIKAPKELNLNESYGNPIELKDLYQLKEETKVEMPRRMARDVQEFTSGKPEDITQDVHQITGGSAYGREVTISTASATPHESRLLEVKTMPIANEIAKRFVFDKKLRVRNSRSLPEGKVDKRRLYKAGAGNYNIFTQRDVLSAPSLAVILLTDVSGSMSGEKLKMAVATTMALKTALKLIDGVSLMALAYHSDFNTELSRIYDDQMKDFRMGIKHGGGTPSGEAIAACMVQASKFLKGKEKMIIHVTDGAPDDHMKVAKAVDYCIKNGVEVITVAIDCYMGTEVQKSYKGMIENISSIRELPEKVATLLKRRLEKRLVKI